MKEIKNAILRDFEQQLSNSGMMFRIFGRAKSTSSLAHKMEMKGDKYRYGGKKIQDMIGIRIVLYFTEDVEALEMFLCNDTLVDRAVDNLDTTTFRPKRLNLVKKLPEEYVREFREKLPADYAQYIDDTYEIQIRTVFSEGWHEVEHDLRYKCQSDWEGCDDYSRQLNGILATLESSQWSMGAIFREMSRKNMEHRNYAAMLRNKFMIRLESSGFSPAVHAFLDANPDVVRALHDSDRVVFIMTMLSHRRRMPLTYDNVFFLINRFDIMNEEVRKLESPEVSKMIDDFLYGE